jgi:hypothetical protein
VRPLLRSPLHRPLRGQLMLLVYTGRKSGRTYTVPIGYFAWGDDGVIAFSSRRWWTNLRDGQTVRLLLRGRWREATRGVAETSEEKAGLLDEFVRRHGPGAARRLLLGLPGDRAPTLEELRRAAEKTTIVRFRFRR